MPRRHFGSIRKLPSGRYQATYWHLAERHIGPDTFTTKGDAQRWLSTIETSIHKGEWVDPAGGRLTVAELAERWKTRDPSKRLSTKTRDEAILRIHILPTLGHRRLRELTPSDVQQIVNAWASENAPRTVDRQYDVLRALFSYAVRSDWIARTPCRNIRLPRVAATQRKALDVDDVAAIVVAIDPRYQPMVWLGAVLGLRWAEVAGLTVGSLDLLRNTVAVTHQLDRDRNLAQPKSDAGRRQFSIPAELSDLLAAHMATSDLTGAEPDGLLFTTRNGAPLDYSHWRTRVWLPAVAKAGRPQATFHDLRRANATTLVAEGIDVKTAQTRLGHADPRTTLGIYAQAVPESDRAAAIALGRKFFGRSRTDRARGA
jgi:integrase